MSDAHGAQPMRREGGARRTVRVWDPFVRVSHWGLVTAFAIAWLTADELQPVHELAGYAVAGLVAFRVIWGLVGSRYARFAQFLAGPAATLGYMADTLKGRERRYLGHNPAGAVMIVATLVTLSGTALTGWLMEGPALTAMLPGLSPIVAPARADDGGEYRAGDRAEGPLKDVHETLANVMLLLVALHVGGVVLASLRHQENLARAMLTGDKRAPEPGDIA